MDKVEKSLLAVKQMRHKLHVGMLVFALVIFIPVYALHTPAPCQLISGGLAAVAWLCIVDLVVYIIYMLIRHHCQELPRLIRVTHVVHTGFTAAKLAFIVCGFFVGNAIFFSSQQCRELWPIGYYLTSAWIFFGYVALFGVCLFACVFCVAIFGVESYAEDVYGDLQNMDLNQYLTVGFSHTDSTLFKVAGTGTVGAYKAPIGSTGNLAATQP